MTTINQQPIINDVYIRQCMKPCAYCTFSKKSDEIAVTHETFTYYRGWQEIVCTQLKSQHYIEETEGCRQYRIYDEWKKELLKYNIDFPLGIDRPKQPIFDKVDFGEYSSKRFYNWYDLMILEENRRRRVELYGSDYESDY
jgi:hypothetical protein